MSIVWAILSKVEILMGGEVVGEGGWLWCGGFGQNILLLLVLIRIRNRIKTRLCQYVLNTFFLLLNY